MYWSCFDNKAGHPPVILHRDNNNATTCKGFGDRQKPDKIHDCPVKTYAYGGYGSKQYFWQ